MFGKGDAITDEDCVPTFFPDYQEIPEDDTTVRWLDRIYPDGTWEANLFQFYRRVLPKIQESLPKPFVLHGDIRIDETPAHVAVREALINLCVHAQYSIDASLVVRRYKNRIVFSNPGSLLVSKYQYYKGGESVCRNKSLQKMFMMLGTAEKAGSGVDKILTGWKEANWKRPYLRETLRPDKVELTLSMESLLPDDVRDGLVGLFGKKVEGIGYDRMTTLALAYTEQEITNERLQYALSIHRHDISGMLKELCTSGLLVAVGHGRGTRYHLPGRGPDVASSGSNVASSGSNVASSGSNVASPGSNVASYPKRLNRSELYALIQDMCSDYLSLDEIAGRIGRKTDYIKNHILNDMLEKGLLERLYPSPRHPRQKYRRKG